MPNIRLLVGWGISIATLMAWMPGCAEPNGQPTMFQEREPTPTEVARLIEPNVLGISCLYAAFNPWIWDIDHTQVRGVKIAALYLLGPNSTGVFGDGIIRPRLSVAQRNAKGEREYVLVKEWEFDVAQAMPFRAKKRSRMGWGYGLFLTWGDLDLKGKDIRMTVAFERADGYVITSTRKDLRVPVSYSKN